MIKDRDKAEGVLITLFLLVIYGVAVPLWMWHNGDPAYLGRTLAGCWTFAVWTVGIVVLVGAAQN